MGSIPFELDERFEVGDRVDVEVTTGKTRQGTVTQVAKAGQEQRRGVWVKMGGKTQNWPVRFVRKLKEETFVTEDGRPGGAGEKVVRKGRVVKKRVNPGFKMEAGKPVRMTPGERRDKQRAAVKGARSRQGASKSIAQKRQRSLNKRKTMGI